MGTSKLYSIVTNDEYELPVATDIEGAKAVGVMLGLSENSVRQHLCRGQWGKRKYKACEIGIKHTDKKAYMKEYGKKRIEKEKLKAITELSRKENNT